MCAGQDAGCEAAVHAIRCIFESQDTEAILLVDASNAFNCLNRETALRNTLRLCPSLGRVLINTYRSDIDLYIDGECFLSREGTTQGDPLAMAMFAVSTLPLIWELNHVHTKQVWYADDATVGGSLPHIRGWWERLQEIGPMYGYYPNASKSWLLVKEQHLHKATDIFHGTDVSITSEGRSVLGSPVGTCAFVDKFVDEKIVVWSNELMALSHIAVFQPHDAYAGFIHCISNRWSYLSRTCPNICNKFDVLEQIIRQRLIPSLIDRNSLNDIERELLSLPIRHGGLGINNPSKISSSSCDASLAVSTPLIDLILHQSLQIPYEAFELQHLTKLDISTIRHHTDILAKDVIYHKLPVSLQKLVDISCEKGASSWLSVIPIQEHGFALHKGAFRDAISLRYGWRPPLLPNNCVCGKSFTVKRAISCPCGGYPSQGF